MTQFLRWVLYPRCLLSTQCYIMHAGAAVGGGGGGGMWSGVGGHVAWGLDFDPS